MFFWLFVFAFPLLWLLVLWVLASASGWSDLSRHYRCNQKIAKNWRGLQNVYVGAIAYGGLIAVACDEGIHLQVLLPFRPFHPALLVPWQDIRYDGKSRILLRRYITLRAGRTSAVSLRVPIGVIDDSRIEKLEDAKKGWE